MKARNGARREPRLFGPRAVPEAPQQSGPDGRERLATGFVPRFLGYHSLKSSTARLMKPQIMEDQGVATVLAVSSAAHVALIAMLLATASHHAHGTPSGQDQPVEMVFDAPPARSGMEGPKVDNPGGQSNPVKTSAPSSAQKQSSESEDKQEQNEEDSRPTPAVPTPEAPSAPPVPEASSSELPQPNTMQSPPTPATAPAGHSTVAHSHAHHSASRHSQASSNNPFANPMDLSFGQSPAPVRNHRGRRGGSGGPIDMSLGPLVTNGQVNAPYMTRNSVRGVSEDYGNEIDHWIRSHMYYPEEAIKNGDEGPSSVHVVLDRNGRVKSVRMTGQSGSYALDAATTGMFQNAKLPPVPPDMKGDHFDIDLTINYILIRR